MKRFYFTMLVVFLFAATSQAKKDPVFKAQDFAKYNIDDIDGTRDGNADFIAAALAIKENFGLTPQGFVGQTTIIDCPGMNKQDIYAQAVLWFESFCEDDKKAELRLDPSQGSTLVARKRLNDVTSKEFKEGLNIKRIPELGGNSINLLINIRLDIKDEKCRLTTTIEDYGIHKTQKNGAAWGLAVLKGPVGIVGAAIGSAVAAAMNVDEKMKPVNNFPFNDNTSFREKYENEKDKKYEKEKKKAEKKQAKDYVENYSTAAVAYVSSFLLIQIVHDKMLDSMTSAPTYGNNNDW